MCCYRSIGFLIQLILSSIKYLVTEISDHLCPRAVFVFCLGISLGITFTKASPLVILSPRYFFSKTFFYYLFGGGGGGGGVNSLLPPTGPKVSESGICFPI